MEKLNFIRYSIRLQVLLVVFLVSISTLYAGELPGSINLKTSSGKEIFKSEADLNIYTAKILKSKFKKELSFKVTSVSHKEIYGGVLTEVNYETLQGDKANYLVLTDLKAEKQKDGKAKIVPSKSIEKMITTLACDGPCFCLIGVLDLPAGEDPFGYPRDPIFYVYCSCSPCVVTFY